MLHLFSPCNCDWILIHQMGKVGSQTLEHSIRQSAPDLRVERHHQLHEGNLKRLETAANAPGTPEATAASLRYQVVMARACAADLFGQPGSSYGCVLTGYRNPIDQVIASVFQNLDAYELPLQWTAASLPRDCEVVGEFLEHWFEQFLDAARTQECQELVCRFPFPQSVNWFDLEFAPFHNLDVYDYPPGKDGLLVIDRDQTRFILYQQEQLETQFPLIMRLIPGLSRMVQDNRNRAVDKPYAALYREFKLRFMPSAAMLEYYVTSKYYRHFYGNRFSQRPTTLIPPVAPGRRSVAEVSRPRVACASAA